MLTNEPPKPIPEDVPKDNYCGACAWIIEMVVEQIGDSKDEAVIRDAVEHICAPGEKMAKQPFLPPMTMYEACMAFVANWEEELIEWLPKRRDHQLDEVAIVFCGKPGNDGGNPGISEACRNVEVGNVIQRKKLEKRSMVPPDPYAHDEL